MTSGFNPLTGMDYPDPDVIRVGKPEIVLLLLNQTQNHDRFRV